jgi:hypothetical protein
LLHLDWILQKMTMKMRKMSDTTSKCRRCKLDLPLDSFHNDKRTANGRYDICKQCRVIHRNITKISDQQYDSLLQAQNNSCAICGIHTSETERGLVVDHNHQTHKIRGLLCTRCNVGLGYYGDDTTKLSMAIEYLIKTDGIA